MNKKKILIIVGIVSVIGIGTGFYLWKKRKKSVEAKESTDDKVKTDVATDVTDNKTPVKSVSNPSATSSATPSATPSATSPATPSATSPATAIKKLSKQEVQQKVKSICATGRIPTAKCFKEVIDNLKSQGLY